jgi:hypothetical protein
MEDVGCRLMGFVTIAKFVHPERCPLGGFYLVNRRKRELNVIVKLALP